MMTQAVDAGAVARAARGSFGLGTARDDRAVLVAGHEMRMRVVSKGGYRFAMFRQSGISWGVNAIPDNRSAILAAAQAYSGCPASGRSIKQTSSNGAFPIYAVHLMC
ncbi:MAG: hypothetical protein AAGH73_04835 [Pseudomonadota bacterium]